MHRVTVFREPGRYAGWPANYGIWSWGDEIVLGFTLGYMDHNGGFHARDRTRPFAGMQARSTNGGESWEVVSTPCTTPGGRGLSADEHVVGGLGVGDVLDGEGAPVDCPGGVDFSHPDFALMCAKTGLSTGAASFFYTSQDRCRSWVGPFRLPMYSETGVAARTDYLVSGASTCTLFLTVNKANGREGRVLCARSTDGGASFPFMSWVGEEPDGFAIMPASVALPDSGHLVAIRCREGRQDSRTAGNWIDLYLSRDDCRTWQYVNRPVERTGWGGNPPTLTSLQDGRLCLTYGFRDAPHMMCAKLSEDRGITWSEEIVLRASAGCHDIGYPRTVQRADGAVVTAYYTTDSPDGEHYIEATVWRP